MRVVIAPDSFKEACSAREAVEAIARGWRSARPQDLLDLVPMADGGEGTVDTVAAAWEADIQYTRVTGPLGDPVDAAFAWNSHHHTAVIEMASASGLTLVPPDKRDPRITTTRGTGELIARALDMGARRIVLGIGGSATNDGGAGALAALGVRLLYGSGQEIPPGGAALARLRWLDTMHMHSRLRQCEIVLACDVDNPLCGRQGASLVYGPQKGATPEMAAELDAALAHFADVVEAQIQLRLRDLPGAGAAGGLAYGLMALAGATMQAGGAIVADAVDLPRHMHEAGLVITGEGRFDSQSLRGKTVHTVARIARAHGVPVLVLAGKFDSDGNHLADHGITAIHAITPKDVDRETALCTTLQNLERAARDAALGWEG